MIGAALFGGSKPTVFGAAHRLSVFIDLERFCGGAALLGESNPTVFGAAHSSSVGVDSALFCGGAAFIHEKMINPTVIGAANLFLGYPTVFLAAHLFSV